MASGTSIVRTGARAANLTAAATVRNWRSPTFAAAQRNTALRFFRQFVSHHTVADKCVGGLFNAAGKEYGLCWDLSETKYFVGHCDGNGGNLVTAGSGITIPANDGRWYRIDVRLNSSANPVLVDVAVDGVALGQASHAIAAFDQAYAFGGSQVSATFTFHDDDVEVDGDGANAYPIGPGQVFGFVPTADGTHSIIGTADFQRGNTAVDILNATTTAWQLVDDQPLPTGAVAEADCIRAIAPPNATDYVECVFGPATGSPTPVIAPRAVEVVLARHEIATGTCNTRTALNDNGTVNDVLNATAAGVVTYRFARKHYATAPTGGAWTVVSGAGNFNNIRSRFFSSDATPDVCLDAIMIEAAFAEPPSPQLLIMQAVKRAAHF